VSSLNGASSDAMLTELYKRVFEEKARCDALTTATGETADRLRQVAIAKNKLLAELIDVRTGQIIAGE